MTPSDPHIGRLSPVEPSEGRGEKRHAAILQAASLIFLRDGFHGASMTEIVKRSGGSKATLYNYFQNKEGLFGAVIKAQCDGILALFQNYEAFGNSLESILLEVGFRLTKALNSPDNIKLFRIIVAESARFPELGALYYKCGPVEGYKLLTPFLQEKLGLDEADAGLAAMQFFDMVKAPLHLQLLIKHIEAVDEATMKRNAERAVKTFLYGMHALSAPKRN